MEKDTRKKTKKMILTALMAAFTCIATMIIKIPTPTLGYIHLGDGLVLLCGFMLGPAPGALAAGTGSMFADIFSGYLSFAPATCIIKALAAGANPLARRHSLAALTGGILGEAIMVTGYFLYEAGLAAFASGGLTPAALAAGAASSAAGIPFNIAQGVAGIAISMLLLPILQTAPGIKGHSS